MCIGPCYSLGYCQNNAIQRGKVRIVDAFPHGAYIDGQRLRHCTRPTERERETGTNIKHASFLRTELVATFIDCENIYPHIMLIGSFWCSSQERIDWRFTIHSD